MPPDTERLDFELEVAAVDLPRRAQRDARGGHVRHRRLLRDERLVGPGRPGPGDEAQASARRRARTSPRPSVPGSSPRTSSRTAATPTGSSTSPWRSGSTAYASELTALATWAGRSSRWSPRLARVLGQGRRGPRLRDLRRAVRSPRPGAARARCPAAAAGRRRRLDDDRAPGHHPQPRSSPVARRCRRHPGPPSRFDRLASMVLTVEGSVEPSGDRSGPDGPDAQPGDRAAARVLRRPDLGADHGRSGRRARRRTRRGRRSRWPSGSRCCAGSAGSSPSAARSTPP